jgi:hypothetical protein
MRLWRSSRAQSCQSFEISRKAEVIETPQVLKTSELTDAAQGVQALDQNQASHSIQSSLSP